MVEPRIDHHKRDTHKEESKDEVIVQKDVHEHAVDVGAWVEVDHKVEENVRGDRSEDEEQHHKVLVVRGEEDLHIHKRHHS